MSRWNTARVCGVWLQQTTESGGKVLENGEIVPRTCWFGDLPVQWERNWQDGTTCSLGLPRAVAATGPIKVPGDIPYGTEIQETLEQWQQEDGAFEYRLVVVNEPVQRRGWGNGVTYKGLETGVVYRTGQAPVTPSMRFGRVLALGGCYIVANILITHGIAQYYGLSDRDGALRGIHRVVDVGQLLVIGVIAVGWAFFRRPKWKTW